METWTRNDGRWYCYELGKDLFGPVVTIHFGGRRSARTRIIPVDGEKAGLEVMEKLAQRRREHHYDGPTEGNGPVVSSEAI